MQATSLVGVKSIMSLHREKNATPLPTVVYLDSAHEEDETLTEITHVMRSLTPGGFLFGDDWSAAR